MSRCESSHSGTVSSQSRVSPPAPAVQTVLASLYVSVTSQRASCGASVVLSNGAHVCIGEEVAGGDATDRLMDVRGCDVSWSSAKCKRDVNILH